MTSLELERILDSTAKDSLIYLIASTFFDEDLRKKYHLSSIHPDIVFDFLEDNKMEIIFKIAGSEFKYNLIQPEHEANDIDWTINDEIIKIPDYLIRIICLILLNYLMIHVKSENNINVKSNYYEMTSHRVLYKYGHCIPSIDSYKLIEQEL